MTRIGRKILRWSGRQGKLAAAAAVGLVIGAAGMAWASIPDAQGVIHACYRTNTGAVRIIDTQTESCSSNETAISWSQVGPAGPAGPQGPAGPNGGGVLRENPTFLYGGNFVGWDLSGADLSGVDLLNANLSGADVRGADLSGAVIGNGDMNFLNAEGANFENASFRYTLNFLSSNFTDANLRNAVFASPDAFYGSRVLGGDFNGADFTGATLNIWQWEGMSWYWDGTEPLSFVTFVGADFTDVAFTPWPYDETRGDDNGLAFVRADFTNANFSGVEFNGGVGYPVRFVDSILAGVDLTAADLTYVEWIDTVCPDGTNSGDHSDTCVGHLAP